MTRQGGRTLAFVRKVNAMKEKPLAKLDADALWTEAEEAIYNFKYRPRRKIPRQSASMFIECDLRGQPQIYTRAFEHARDRWNAEHPEE
jgi:hypothetical protein